jgi:energy-coupling factor transporter ATP-binding protein EcfA2
MDRMTVREHLRFYAQIRGVKEVEHNVKEIIRAVGLEAFQTRMAISLSGGNKRKLSLGIALTVRPPAPGRLPSRLLTSSQGNPSVLLLDEPSSGMDVSAKRVMWRTLAAIIPGRSIVLTTHSMEEADALANRAGIMAKRMLALGTSDYLRKKHGNRYHVHLLMKSAPHTGAEEADRVRAWIADTFPSADMDEKAFHGQIRFSVPVGGARPASPVAGNREPSEDDVMAIESAAGAGKGGGVGGSEPGGGGVVGLFSALERSKGEMGFEYYSVSQTTLDQVFLSIVR